MAYISQDEKKNIATELKKLFPNLRFSLSIRDKMCLVVSLKSGNIDFTKHLIAFNSAGDGYHASAEVKANRVRKLTNGHALEIRENRDELKRTPEVGAVLQQIFDVINQRGTDTSNFDDTDIHTDYFSVGYYIDFVLGKKGDENGYNGVGYELK